MAALEEISCVHSFCLDVRVDDQIPPTAMLRDGSVLAAITADCSPVPSCRIIALGAMRYVAVASRPFVSRYFEGGVDTTRFARAPMLQFNSKDELQRRFMRKFTDDSPSPPTHFIPSSMSFIDASRRGIGWCVLPELMARQYLKNRELVEISPGKSFDVPLYMQRYRIKSHALDVLTRVVRDVATQFLEQDDPPPAKAPRAVLRDVSSRAAATMSAADRADCLPARNRE
jgi:LysR family transcriptional regulator (chromosome initiation inhibitor)